MVATLYSQEKILVGSSLYYSLRLLPTDKQPLLTLLHGFFIEINDVIYECKDMQVAMAKLQWWAEEVERSEQNKAQHPIMQSLQPFIKAKQLSFSNLHAIIQQFQQTISMNRCANFSELHNLCRQLIQHFSLLNSQILDIQDKATHDYANAMGTALQLYDFFRKTRQCVLNGRVYIPQDFLAYYAVTEQMLFDCEHNNATQQLFSHQALLIEQHLHQALTLLPKKYRKQQRYSVARAKLALATLREMEATQWQLLKQQVNLTPIRKLWISMWVK
jgi:phytoene synthase